MSYSTWHNYGIGINTDLIKIDPVRVSKFIAMVPSFKQNVEKAITDHLGTNWQWNTLTINDLLDAVAEMDDFVGSPMSYFIHAVIYDREGIFLSCCTNYNDEGFVIYQPSYPWEQNNCEHHLTEDGLKQMFEKYVAVLTDQSLQDLHYGHQEVENGG